VGAVRARALDADLAALLWLLVDGDLPLVVAGGTSDQRATLLAALGGLPGARNDAPDHIAPNGVWGSVLRGRIASLKPGDRFRATAEVGSLRELLELLDGPAIGLTDDEIRTCSTPRAASLPRTCCGRWNATAQGISSAVRPRCLPRGTLTMGNWNTSPGP
jgi:hypothetical protein